jgi:hypothetical protein
MRLPDHIYNAIKALFAHPMAWHLAHFRREVIPAAIQLLGEHARHMFPAVL